MDISKLSRLTGLPKFIDEVAYQINYDTSVRPSSMSIVPDSDSQLERLRDICSIKDWLKMINQSDRDHYLHNLDQAATSDQLISAYRINMERMSILWVLDRSRCIGKPLQKITGKLLVTDNMDIVAKIVGMLMITK